MIKFFRVAGYLEGISLLFLLCVAMPLKHVYGMPMAVKVSGWFHGLFFLSYVGSLAVLASEFSWNRKKTLTGFMAGIVPLGTFFFDRHANANPEL